ncbi:unnamed protein product [Spirodela intermedia]|uniref:Uncharacterized protein n=1 Tax=Spirodela intermedia TaxID=51605 RepID=A0A7I8IHJ4_SPIIN|nr:unnamed protein product [Spirodela intermedia]CAA6656977.1 unnamed protein product [Spirodela intermedia]
MGLHPLRGGKQSPAPPPPPGGVGRRRHRRGIRDGRHRPARGGSHRLQAPPTRDDAAIGAVEGVAPRVALPWGPVELNVTLSLDFAVFNPNRASFDHAAGKAALFYRGKRVGTRLTVEADRFAADPLALVRDVLTGHLDVDSSTRIPGRVTFLGFIHHHVVILTDCHVTISFPPWPSPGSNASRKRSSRRLSLSPLYVVRRPLRCSLSPYLLNVTRANTNCFASK